jgi:hypothetical protein
MPVVMVFVFGCGSENEKATYKVLLEQVALNIVS